MKDVQGKLIFVHKRALQSIILPIRTHGSSQDLIAPFSNSLLDLVKTFSFKVLDVVDGKDQNTSC